MPEPASERVFSRPPRGAGWGAYVLAAATAGACTVLCWPIRPYVEQTDLSFVYLVGIVAVSANFGLWPSVVTAALGGLAYDFFFIPPYFQFVVADWKDLVTYAMMFGAAVFTGGLTDRLRIQRETARRREHRMSHLYALSQELSGARDRPAVEAVAARHLDQLMGAEPESSDAYDRALRDTVLRLVASTRERLDVAERAEAVRVEAESEKLRSDLLSAVSHDLRTPLATIEGAATALLRSEAPLDEDARTELLSAIVDEAGRLGRLVRNLLDMTRIDSGRVRVPEQKESIEEVVGAALGRLESRLRGRNIEAHIAPDVPLVSMDAVLIQQVLINLLENAERYTPSGSALALSARIRDGQLLVEVEDRGPGLVPGTEERIFEKFYRGRGEHGGAGLGLAICRAVVVAHGGRIWAENRKEGGARFAFTLPLSGAPTLPAVDNRRRAR